MAEAELTAEQLKEQLDSIKAEKDKLNSDLEFQKAEAKKAFEKRDEYKKLIEETEKKKLEENNEFKTLYEQKAEAEKKLLADLEDLKPYKEKYTALETEIRKELLDVIKDEDLRKIGESLSTEQLKVYSSKHKDTAPPPGDGNRSGKAKLDYANVKYDDLTAEQLDTLKKENPERYAQLRKEKYKF